MTRIMAISLALFSFALASGSPHAALHQQSAPPKNPIPAELAISPPITESGTTDRPVYRNAYYLFQAGTISACEDCYVPLLITPEPLDEIAKQTANANCVWITTYERDSIWQMNGIVGVAPRSIEAPQRVIRLNGHSYRYQEITTHEVLKLLEKPNGTIPISRPYVPDKSEPGSKLADLIWDFRIIFRIRERQLDPAPIQKGEEAALRKVLMSELSVLDDGTARYRVATGCFGRLNWDWKSQCSDSASSEKIFEYKLSPTQLLELKALLERQEVQGISNFMNAAPIFDDFDIEIPRPERSQHIVVLTFMPDHFELQQHPALTHVVCKAKGIEAAASNTSETPNWCKNIPPLN
jgi:hypothetical protein